MSARSPGRPRLRRPGPRPLLYVGGRRGAPADLRALDTNNVAFSHVVLLFLPAGKIRVKTVPIEHVCRPRNWAQRLACGVIEEEIEMMNPRKISLGSSALGYGLPGLLLVLGSLTASNAFAQTAPPVVLQCWASGPPESPIPGPWWVPLSLLNKPYETWDAENRLKVSEEKLKEFKEVVAEVSNRGRSGRCVPAPEGLVSVGGGDGRVSIKGAAGHAPVVITATVLSVEPGWDLVTNIVGSLVRARIEEVVKGAGLARGQEIMYLRPWGVLRYGKTILCTSIGRYNLVSDLEGDFFDSSDLKVLVVGWKSDFNKSFIETTAAGEFKIVLGRFVSTAGYPSVEPAEFSLDDLI